MIRAVVQGDFDINHRVASQNTGLHSALDTLVNGANVLFGDSTAHDGVDELVALAGLVGLDFDFYMAVLAFTTGLTGVFVIHVGQFADGFFVGNLGFTHIGFHLELAEQTVHDNFQM